MAEHGLTALFAVVAWWLSTGAILWLCLQPRRTHGRSMLGATLLLPLALYGLAASADDAGPAGAYVAFVSALAVWGWIEMTFLLGFVTGPRVAPCPDDATGWRRFRLAAEALLYHELLIVAGALAAIALTWDAPNQTGTLAFLVLTAMRISAKLNIFLGVPNLTDEFMPAHLHYLKSYFRKRPFNALFPVSVIASGAVAVALAQRAIAAEAAGADAAGTVLVCALLALAILEHFFMMMPLRDAALWRWAMPVAASKPTDKGRV
ncbi:MAG: putative photosynthetic complex assembly protein PuhE [Rhodospirillaceae bacterium]|nr:putative photosynthetic complex assembly protein PuhE [Rhodospirillaceae bacterium]